MDDCNIIGSSKCTVFSLVFFQQSLIGRGALTLGWPLIFPPEQCKINKPQKTNAFHCSYDCPFPTKSDKTWCKMLTLTISDKTPISVPSTTPIPSITGHKGMVMCLGIIRPCSYLQWPYNRVFKSWLQHRPATCELISMQYRIIINPNQAAYHMKQALGIRRTVWQTLTLAVANKCIKELHLFVIWQFGGCNTYL